MGYKWYVIQVVPGREEGVSKSILEISERSGMADDFCEVFIPYEEVVCLRRNKRCIVKRRLSPGYVFICMIMSDRSFRLVKGVSQVSGFLNEAGLPKEIEESQISSMKSKICQSVVDDKVVLSYDVGDEVKINGGPFQYLSARIDFINEDKGVAKVLITMFGRTTRVELELNHIEKAEDNHE